MFGPGNGVEAKAGSEVAVKTSPIEGGDGGIEWVEVAAGVASSTDEAPPFTTLAAVCVVQLTRARARRRTGIILADMITTQTE